MVPTLRRPRRGAEAEQQADAAEEKARSHHKARATAKDLPNLPAGFSKAKESMGAVRYANGHKFPAPPVPVVNVDAEIANLPPKNSSLPPGVKRAPRPAPLHDVEKPRELLHEPSSSFHNLPHTQRCHRGRMATRESPKCPAGHAMVVYAFVLRSKMVCDSCNTSLDRDSQKKWGCTPCDVDMCARCIEQLPGSEKRAAPRRMYEPANTPRQNAAKKQRRPQRRADTPMADAEDDPAPRRMG